MFLLWLRQLPWCGDQTPASVPPPAKGKSSPTYSPLLPLLPSSYWVLCGSIYSFLVFRYSCSLSAGVLQVFLCLKVYSWCIWGKRCTPRPFIPPSSCLYIKVFTRDKHWLFTLFLLLLLFQRANRKLTVNASAGAHLLLVSRNASRRLVNFSTGAYLSFVSGNANRRLVVNV